MWYNWSGNPESQYHAPLYGFGRNGIHPYSDSLVEPSRLVPLFLQDESFIPGGVLIRKHVLKSVGGYEEKFRDYYEDWVVMCKVCLTSSVFVSSEVTYKYRKHPDSSTYVWEQTGRDKAHQLKFCRWMETYLSEQGNTDSEIWQKLREKRRYCRFAKWYRLLHCHTYLRGIENLMMKLGRRILPATVRHWLWLRWKGTRWPPPGWVRMGSFRRVTPISHTFGYDRGHPIDRYYIKQFLKRQANDIRGHVLESKDDTYTRAFGGDRVSHSDVLHKTEDNPRATIVADLTCADQILSNNFDCIILTQVLQFIYNVRDTVKTLYRILKPGGVVLVTVPGITPICHPEMEAYGQYWSFTSLSIKKLFEEFFPTENIRVETRGNVLVANAFLYGLAVRELRQKELDYNDPSYELIITLRAEKPGRKDGT
jgi:SAM-dependent methyltransferase